MDEKVKALIRRHEGYRNDMYKDSKGIWTIGVGHNLEEHGLSDAAVDFILEEDLQMVIDECRKKLKFFRDLDEVRQAAIIDMVFNMGMPTFLTFKKTIRFIEQGLLHSAANEMLRGSSPDSKSKWYSQVGPRALRISEMMKTGEWQ